MDCAGWELNYSRAGRDGLDSDCIVFYSWPDVLAYDRMGDLAADENVLAMRREQARDLFGLLQSPGCRHRALVAHFGERLDRCETSCDSCLASDFLGGLPVAGRIRAVRRVAGSPNPRSPRPRATVELDGSEEALFLELKALRKRLAAEQHVPPYVVFSDAVLVAIARERPEDDDALLTISGVGPKKLAKYGSLFLECVRNAHPWRGATARRRTPGSDSVHPALRSDREPGELAELLAFFRVPFAARILRSLEPVVDRNRDGIGVGSVQTGWRRTQAGLRLALGLGVASGLGACIGTIGDGGQNGAGGPSSGTNPPYQSATTEFKCDSDLIPDEVPLKRLSKAQLTNTVGDLVRFALPGAAAAQDSTLGVLQPLLALIPDEHRDGPFGEWGGFKSVDQVVNQEHVDRGYAVAVALGSELAKPERLSLAAGDCATDGDGGNDSACLDAFIRRFGERVLRREVLDADVAFYRAPAGTPPYDQADWADVIALLAAAPHALYFVEHAGGDDSTTAPVQALDAYELASRLSYHFWQSAPDDELFALARSGELLDETVYAEQVERVFASPKTRSAVRTFYSEWFQRDDVAQMNSRVGTPAFDTLRGEFLPSTELRGAMFDEVADMATYYSLDTDGVLSDLYTTTKSFARTDELAGLYHAPVWDGASEPPENTEPRAGLLTRAAMVASGSTNTRPIMKGVFIRRALLCDTLAPPPPDVMATPIEVAANQTARVSVAAVTSEGRCAGCHTYINGLGFATENFDALGRFRDEELLISPESGEIIESRPVDTSSVPYVTSDDDAIDGPRALQDAMLASGKVEACFARTYFRFTFSRAEDVAKDGCALKDLHETLKRGEPLDAVLRRVALSPAFRERSFGEP